MQSKKRIIIISIIVFSLALIILLSSTVFTLKTVSIEARTTSLYLAEEDYDEIIESAKFDYGKNIFFLKTDGYKANIEKANPYVKVINIERKFPNYIVVNISERVPAVRIQSSKGYYVLDKELKVLNNVDNLTTKYNDITKEELTPIFSFGSGITDDYSKNLEVGDFLSGERLSYFVNAVYNGLVSTDEQTGSPINCLSNIETVSVSYEQENSIEKLYLTFKDSSVTATIYNGKDLTDRIYTILQLYLTYQETYTEYRCSINGLYTADGGEVNI